MFTALKLKDENIAEYLLYMWQVEDLLRACQLDIDIVKEKYLSKFSGLTPEQQRQQEKWYEDLIEMMHSEHVTRQGHLQINRNVIANLEELHAKLLAHADKYPYYKAAYYNALPAIVELRRKSGIDQKGEIETCFNLLYGIMLLRMQGKPIEQDTQGALKLVSNYISMLSSYYHQDKQSSLDLDD